ncbi:hypothetical protein [Leptobacterium sp. I13]|uniref:hypothetical protein n=1 Tax=Leptobacterium meishanense TaxID=3128904 RepID=UPI0030ECA341
MKLLHNIKKHPFFIKCSSWEHWPMLFLYIPVYIQHIWLSIKAGNPFFFFITNPAITEGFILSDSKYKTLTKLVPQEHLPLSMLISNEDSLASVIKRIEENKMNFPIILKPDIGYRGLSVYKINNEEALEEAFLEMQVDCIVQEYIDYPIEIGVFYYRMPNEVKGKIPSITIKEFLKVTGDGTHTLAELVQQNPRAILQKEKLKKKFHEQWNEVIPEKKQLVLEHIGNHNRGTKFVNAANLYDMSLQNVFDALNKKMKGFYFGRFDIRAKSVEDLKKGQNFKILEVNGVGAEPTHVYDPNYKLVAAWKELLFLWRIAYKIAAVNKNFGLSYPSLSEGRKRWLAYKKYKKVFKP